MAFNRSLWSATGQQVRDKLEDPCLRLIVELFLK